MGTSGDTMVMFTKKQNKIKIKIEKNVCLCDHHTLEMMETGIFKQNVCMEMVSQAEKLRNKQT